MTLEEAMAGSWFSTLHPEDRQRVLNESIVVIQSNSEFESGSFRQILLDLISNAIKFTAQGAVVVRLGVSAQPVIIALTASAMPGDREECLAAGMNDYRTKPWPWPRYERAGALVARPPGTINTMLPTWRKNGSTRAPRTCASC